MSRNTTRLEAPQDSGTHGSTLVGPPRPRPPDTHGRPRRVAMLSVHTSPLHQPGTGDAGGMNVYIVELAKRLAALDIEVEIFTRATCAALPPSVELVPGVLVRHVAAGPYEGLAKEDLPAQPELPGAITVFHVGGADDFLLHVAVASPRALHDLILEHITTHPIVRQTETQLVFEVREGRGVLPG